MCVCVCVRACAYACVCACVYHQPYIYCYFFQLMKAEWLKRLEYKSFYISVPFIHFFIHI